MNILITGGTGFIGTALCKKLCQAEHNVIILSRQPIDYWQGANVIHTLDKELYLDAVINLAGEPIADKRWSDQQKQQIIDSRLDVTESVIQYLKSTSHKPKVFISGSAIGYYGIRQSNQRINEKFLGDDSFSSSLCRRWETLAEQAEDLGIRTCLLRTGIVLGKQGGALKKMILPFKLGLGGPVSHGKQWMPWIHIDDMTSLIIYCIDHTQIKGPINCTAPNPVTNKEFTQQLGRALHRPTVFKMPGVLIKGLLGEMGHELLLSGLYVVPEKAEHYNYCFQYPELKTALKYLVGSSSH